jgi:hypothetical protein
MNEETAIEESGLADLDDGETSLSDQNLKRKPRRVADVEMLSEALTS